ncbi:MAG: SDR family oxidoreductase, partial [Pseudomonadota bacterium]
MSDSTGLMAGKRGLIMGVANDRSIAWGIAEALHNAGAELALTYQGDAFAKRVKPLAERIGCDTLIDCDVTDDASLDAAFDEIGKKGGKIDFLVHAIAFSDKRELDGRYLDTTADNFRLTMDISCY